jgi:hypothetical protein
VGTKVVFDAAKTTVESREGRVGIAEQEVLSVNNKINPVESSPFFIESSSAGV